MKKNLGIVSLALFAIGLILSVVGGLFFSGDAWVVLVLAIFGLIIGLIYVFYAKKEVKMLLLATIALLATTAAFSPITTLDIGTKVGPILVDFAALMAPVALIAAVKALIQIGIEK